MREYRLRNVRNFFILSFFIIILGLLISQNLFTFYDQDESKSNIDIKLSIGSGLSNDLNFTWGDIDDDICSAIALDSSDNIYIGGHTKNPETGDFKGLLLKYDELGNQSWIIKFGGDDGNDFCTDIAVNTSESIYLMGYSNSYPECDQYDAIMYKYYNMSYGISVRRYSHWIGEGNDYGRAIIFDNDGNILQGLDFHGSLTFNDRIYIAKLGSDLSQKWSTSYFSLNSELFFAGITFDQFGYIYAGGYQLKSGKYEIILLKYGSNGILQWDNIITAPDDQIIRGIDLDSSGNIYLTGSVINDSGAEEMYLVKFNNMGDIQWNRTWRESNSAGCNDIIVDSEDNIYLVGFTGNNLNKDMAMVKFDKGGNIIWSQIWDKSDEDIGTSIAFNSYGDICVGGTWLNGIDTDTFVTVYSNDDDNDGLSNWQERNVYFTNGNNNDTDGDDLSDYDELFVYNTSPVLNDTDNDDWTDGDEVLIYGTDPLDADSYPMPEKPPKIFGYNIIVQILIFSIVFITYSVKKRIKIYSNPSK